LWSCCSLTTNFGINSVACRCISAGRSGAQLAHLIAAIQPRSPEDPYRNRRVALKPVWRFARQRWIGAVDRYARGHVVGGDRLVSSRRKTGGTGSWKARRLLCYDEFDGHDEWGGGLGLVVGGGRLATCARPFLKSILGMRMKIRFEQPSGELCCSNLYNARGAAISTFEAGRDRKLQVPSGRPARPLMTAPRISKPGWRACRQQGVPVGC
jgi:hypothetical protein